jgi:hypothetical protein
MDVRNHELSLFKQRRRGTLLFSLWEPLLKAIKHESVMNLLVPFVDINKHLSQNLFYALYMFSKP